LALSRNLVEIGSGLHDGGALGQAGVHQRQMLLL
jgi:hypothetical protein